MASAVSGLFPKPRSPAWPPASQAIRARRGVPLRCSGGSFPPRDSPTQALQRPTQDITEVLSPPQREAGLGVWEPTAPFPCSPRSHRVGHCEDTHGSPVTAERRVPCEHEFSKGRGRGGLRNAEVVKALCPSRDRPARTVRFGGHVDRLPHFRPLLGWDCVGAWLHPPPPLQFNPDFRKGPCPSVLPCTPPSTGGCFTLREGGCS